MARSTNNQPSSMLRSFVGFVIGGLPAAIAAAIIFLAFFPMPPESTPAEHTAEALAVLLLVTFFCGGFIGRKGFNADGWFDLMPPFVGSYILIGLLCYVSTLDLHEKTMLVGFASVGMITSAVVSMVFLGCFPPKPREHRI